MSQDNNATTAAFPKLPRANLGQSPPHGAATAAFADYTDYRGNPQPPPYSAGAVGGHGGPGPPPGWQGDALQPKGDVAATYETIDGPPAAPGTGYQEQRGWGQPGVGMQPGGGMHPNAYNQRPGMEPQQFGQAYPAPMNSAYPYAMGGAVHPQVIMVAHPTQPSKPYFARSILATVFCCFLLGIFAIVGAVETRSANERGDFVTAQASSRRTKILLIVSLCCGILLYLAIGAYFIVFFVVYYNYPY
ncbi:uncharacterized protein LOC144739919 [Lampetra planeri]